MSGLPASRAAALPAALTAALLAAACGGGGDTPPPPAPLDRATESEWRELALPRPLPLEGAPRVALGEVRLAGAISWSTPAGVDAELGLAELAIAGLLERRDVRFVERRRFAAAVDAERRGLPRPAGAPAAGTSPGAQFVALATWAALEADSGRVDVRLADPGSGAVVAAWRGATPPGVDAVSLARAVVGGVLAALDQAGARPAGSGPVALPAGGVALPAAVPEAAVAAFFRGLAEEEAWRWEEARRHYQRALAAAGGGFPEAAAALARTARLRNGGTLGEG